MQAVTRFAAFAGRKVAYRRGLPVFVVLLVLAARLEVLGFEPKRQFPDTRDTIRVFVDQLPLQVTPAQRKFAATRFVGAQKMLAEQVDGYRDYNSKFIMIQYRLGTRQADMSIVHIHKNRWCHDWEAINQHDDWFIHTQGRVPWRLYMTVGKTREYIMDISGQINGNTTDGWKEYWVRTVVADVIASHADGVFADSTHIPFAIPPKLYNSPLGAPPYESYLPHLEAFYDYVYAKLDRANLYLIPNIGHLTTGWDTTQGYYEDVHGAMVEGFANVGNTEDWIIQQNNTLKLLRNGKIYIAQSAVGETDVKRRIWLLSNFLLLKHNRSYINMLAAGYNINGNLHWWPEYDLKLGAPAADAVPESIDELKSPAGVYYRRFEQGLVIVNPSDTQRAIALGEGRQYLLITPWGGGLIDGRGGVPKGGLKGLPLAGSVTVEPWSGAILVATLSRPVR